MKTILFSNRVKYNSYYSLDLIVMIDEFCKEVYGKPCSDDFTMTRFIEEHDYIVLVMDDGDPIGFASCIIHDNCGLTNNRMVVDAMYIEPEYRKSKAFLHLMVKLGEIVQHNKCDFSLSTFNEELVLMAKKFKANKVYEVIEYSYEDSVTEYNRLTKLLER